MVVQPLTTLPANLSRLFDAEMLLQSAERNSVTVGIFEA